MHDPMTVAFEIKYPWRQAPSDFWPKGYRDTFITIWHVDPEHHGDDDSCDWFGRSRRLNSKEMAIVESMWDLETLLDNRPHFPDSPEHKAFQVLKEAVWKWRRRDRYWWQHPRYHFWHWRLQIHPLQKLKRFLFERCSVCGKRYAWGYCPTRSWGGKKTWHNECDPSAKNGAGLGRGIQEA